MYIKSIVLDGFKSYGNRVEITGFDPEFNAITGLNGTGKSNILDSICFVLGITNLSNVRAGSLQELIYKHGQAGITKATVSITFDNRNKAQCLIGYENHDEITVTRQVVMGGKNKYMINGINVQNKRVSDLFCSVQLNVNNPHFLIMQGRITKVLNMKPPEILSMVEEAAGTRMYEAKKQAAQKTIEKKDTKLKDLNNIIREEIAPKLQKLLDERTQFQEYQKAVRELENLTRLYVAWKYVSAAESVNQAVGKVTVVELDISSQKEAIKNNENVMKDLDTQVAELNRRLDQESGSVLKELETQLQALEKNDAVANSAHKAAKEALATHEKRARLLEKALKEDELALETKKHSLEEVASAFENLRSASEASEVALAEAQRKFLAVSSGLEGDSDESLQDQLMAAKQEASEASTRISQSMMEKKHAENRLATLEREFQASSAQFNKDQESILRQQAELNRLQDELSKMKFNEMRSIQLKTIIQDHQQIVDRRKSTFTKSLAQLRRVDFSYDPPHPNFDRRAVSGIVCKLIDVCDPMYCTALETAAGGRLYNVVVDTEVTSKLLLQKGNLRSRTTIIPLNKISGYVIDEKTVRLAQQVGGGPENVQLALNLISFESHLYPAMAWIFGSTLVCKDLEIAKRVTFHPQIRKKSVTLDGDVFDPAGTLSGGARNTDVPVLLHMKKLKGDEEELKSAEAQLNANISELDAMQSVAESYHRLKQRCELRSHELHVVKERIAATEHAQTHAEIQALRNQVMELTAAVERDQVTQREMVARARALEAKVKDIKGHRERTFKKAEEELKKAKKDAEYHGNSWKQHEQELETLKLEVQELEKAVATSRQQLQEIRDGHQELSESLESAAAEHHAATEAVKQIQALIKQKKDEIASKSSDITRFMKRKEQLAKNNRELELKIKELELKIKELKTEAKECEARIRNLETENPWIPSEKEYFGGAGGLYDFEGRQAHLAGPRLEQLKERKEKLSRGLNARAHTLLGKEEEQYQDMMNKKRTVEMDRAKLVQVMAELDDKKKRTLVKACEQVNRDFGSIFSTLLPGAQAKLTPPEGLSVLDGLEVKVGFNNTWKDSLGELSGGQRSLVALSLVLAMLLFKPAPLYILDEVDAALDLSHTQNIGQMLKEHFKHSQFIIVSLKDGMFNNANVLFRTRFVDGMSSVQRTVSQRQ